MKKLFGYFLLSVLFIGCKKENTETQDFKPAFTTLDLTSKVPSTLQQNAPMAYSQLLEMGAFMNLGSSFMQMTGKAPITDVSNTQWNYLDYTVTYNYNLVGNRYVYDYSISQNGVNFYTITGWENSDGSAGHWAFTMDASVAGAPTSDVYNISFDWTKNSSNDYHFDMVFDMGSSQLIHYTANINHDMSGDYAYYLNNQLSYKCNWLSNGHGQFTDYSSIPPTIQNF